MLQERAVKRDGMGMSIVEVRIEGSCMEGRFAIEAPTLGGGTNAIAHAAGTD